VRRGLCYDQRHIWRVTGVVTLPDILPCLLRGGSETSGQGRCLTRIVALYQAILDIATYLSLNELLGHPERKQDALPKQNGRFGFTTLPPLGEMDTRFFWVQEGI
jgi:hypothetical protein